MPKCWKAATMAAVVVFLALGCSSKPLTYTDPKGRFQVDVPGGLRVQESNDLRSKVQFSKGNTSLSIIVKDYYDTPTVPEWEKNRARSNAPQDFARQMGVQVGGIWETAISVDGVEGWCYGFKVPSQGLDLRTVVFVKNRKWHTISLVSSQDSAEVWQAVLSSFHSR